MQLSCLGRLSVTRRVCGAGKVMVVKEVEGVGFGAGDYKGGWGPLFEGKVTVRGVDLMACIQVMVTHFEAHIQK